jgi:hypothetical protein
VVAITVKQKLGLQVWFLLSVVAFILFVPTQGTAVDHPWRTIRNQPFQTASGAWTQERAVAFGTYRLDFESMLENWLPFEKRGIVDCSTAEMLCLTTRGAIDRLGVMHLSLPRRCEPVASGAVWAVSGVATEVAGRRDEAGSAAWVLRDSERPQYAWVYRPNDGVIALAVGRKGEDTAAALLAGKDFGHLYLRRSNPEPFGACGR